MIKNSKTKRVQKFYRYHAKRLLSRRIAFKAYRREKNKKNQGVSNPKRKYDAKFRERYKDYKKITAPQNFTLIGNPQPVIEFISKLKGRFEAKQKVIVVLQQVKNIDYDAIVLLLSIMVKFKAQKIDFNGDFPKDEKARSILTDSGFFKALGGHFRDENRYDISKSKRNLIHTHAQKNVDSVLTANIIEQASKTIWGEGKRCQGVQRTLVELMLNTNNHATIGMEGDKHWWLSVNHHSETNKVSFSFVDYGVGVFNSLEKKPVGNKFYRVLDKMTSLFKYTNNADLLKLIFNGELHKTVTEQYWRGKGLPGIYEAFKRNSFSRLYIVSNDVYADVENNVYRKLNCNFSGTFIYFELNPTNLNCNGIH